MARSTSPRWSTRSPRSCAATTCCARSSGTSTAARASPWCPPNRCGSRSARSQAPNEAERVAEEQARAPISLESGLNLRPLLIRLGAEEHWFCLTLHHIACDGWSLALLEHEISAFYQAFQNGETADVPELTAQYTDFAAWQTSQEIDEPLAYWREKLAGIPALSGLPTDFPRPPAQTYAGAHLDFVLPAHVAEEVAELARTTTATPFAVLLAAFSAFVHAYTGTDEVVTGSPAAGRSRPEVQHLVGFFANTVVHRLDVSGQPTFRELVERTRAESRAAMVHQDLPFEKLVEELHPVRDPSHNPLFQLMFSYQDTDGEPGLKLPGCEVAMAPGDTATAKFDLTLSMTNAPERLSFRLEYATDLFTEATAHQIGEQFQTLLAGALADPDRSIGALPVLTEVDLDRVLIDWNPASAPIGADLVHELIAAQAARTPDAPALLGADQDPADALSYREVDERADALAARLRGHGVGPGVPVGVYLDRSPELVITLLAILKAGGGYLPLDPGYPQDRLAFMVADSATPVLVSRAGLARRLDSLSVTVVRIDEPGEAVVTEVTWPAQEDLAYLIYTSGSTGKPKGVMLSHRNVLNFFTGMDRVLGGDDPGTWLAVTSMSFDISVLELLWTLARGYRVVVRGDEPTAARQEGGAVVPASAQAKTMDFSLFYFGGDKGGDPADRYRLLMEGAKFADRNGFSAVWTPERHFHEFGGLYPNPSVTASAIAAVTENIAVRAGSVVLPLHDPLRVAEEWSIVDNLSHGRVGISIASGLAAQRLRARAGELRRPQEADDGPAGGAARAVARRQRPAPQRRGHRGRRPGVPAAGPGRPAGVGHQRAQPRDVPDGRGGGREPAHPPARAFGRAAVAQDRAVPPGLARERPLRRRPRDRDAALLRGPGRRRGPRDRPRAADRLHQVLFGPAVRPQPGDGPRGEPQGPARGRAGRAGGAGLRPVLRDVGLARHARALRGHRGPAQARRGRRGGLPGRLRRFPRPGARLAGPARAGPRRQRGPPPRGRRRRAGGRAAAPPRRHAPAVHPVAGRDDQRGRRLPRRAGGPAAAARRRRGFADAAGRAAGDAAEVGAAQHVRPDGGHGLGHDAADPARRRRPHRHPAGRCPRVRRGPVPASRAGERAG